MPAHYSEDLVYTQTDDGLTLEGAVIRPTGESRKPIAVVFVHGLTSKFYTQTAVMLGRELTRAGYTFVTGNNRGHDFGTMYVMDGERILQGGGWELFSESPRDVAAWIDFATGLGFGRVALVGHSLGARKVGYYQATRQDPRVATVVAVSPPNRTAQPRDELLEQARGMVAEGRGRDLLPWGISQAGAGTVSAQTYVDRVDPGFDVYGTATPEPLVTRIRCPLYACYGTDEAWVGGADDLERIRALATGAARVETHLFDGATHSYTAHEPALAAALARWIDELP